MTNTRRKTTKARTARSTSGTAADVPTGRDLKKRPGRVKAGGKAGAGKRQTKKAAVLGLLRRPDGATIEDLTEATGWQGHSVRAALTGLRKEGHEIVRTGTEAGVTRYRIAGAR